MIAKQKNDATEVAVAGAVIMIQEKGPLIQFYFLFTERFGIADSMKRNTLQAM